MAKPPSFGNPIESNEIPNDPGQVNDSWVPGARLGANQSKTSFREALVAIRAMEGGQLTGAWPVVDMNGEGGAGTDQTGAGGDLFPGLRSADVPRVLQTHLGNQPVVDSVRDIFGGLAGGRLTREQAVANLAALNPADSPQVAGLLVAGLASDNFQVREAIKQSLQNPRFASHAANALGDVMANEGQQVTLEHRQRAREAFLALPPESRRATMISLLDDLQRAPDNARRTRAEAIERHLGSGFTASLFAAMDHETTTDEQRNRFRAEIIRRNRTREDLQVGAGRALISDPQGRQRLLVNSETGAEVARVDYVGRSNVLSSLHVFGEMQYQRQPGGGYVERRGAGPITPLAGVSSITLDEIFPGNVFVNLLNDRNEVIDVAVRSLPPR